MSPSRLKLVLVVLWLVPGLGLLAVEAWTGRAVAALSLGNARVPLSYLFLFFAAFNLLRWWVARTTRDSADHWRSFRNRPSRRTDGTAETDTSFRFDDPPR